MIDGYSISTAIAEQDQIKIWSLLKDCFWCKDIPIEYVARFIKYSLCFGIYLNSSRELVGFGRVISDYTTYAYVCDIIIDSKHRKKGLATALVNAMLQHSELQGLKNWVLRTTEEGKNVYQRAGFTCSNNPCPLLEITDLDIYTKPDFVNLHQFIKQ